MLEKLNISFNHIAEWPDNMGALVRMREIDCRDNNNLEEIPEGVGQWTRLKKASFRNTHIEFLPEDLRHCTALEELDVRDNVQLAEISPIVGDLVALKRLDLFGCALPGLPITLGALQALIVLDLRNNQVWSRLFFFFYLLPCRRLSAFPLCRLTLDPPRLPPCHS